MAGRDDATNPVSPTANWSGKRPGVGAGPARQVVRQDQSACWSYAKGGLAVSPLRGKPEGRGYFQYSQRPHQEKVRARPRRAMTAGDQHVQSK